MAKKNRTRLHLKLLAWPATLLYELWRMTMRIQCINLDFWNDIRSRHPKIVLALWHDELFALPGYRHSSGLRFVTIVSTSRDAELLAGILKRLDIIPARGSSSKGGAGALAKAARIMRTQDRDGVVTVDGPRGPRHKAKDGAIYLAHLTGAAIVPLRLYYSRKKTFGSWDRFQLPMPFSRCTMITGEPMLLDPETELTRERMAELAVDLEHRLETLTLPEQQ